VYPGYLGLKKSTNGGATWADVPAMHGIAVQNVAFDPTPGSHDMVLATSDGLVFRSPDDGATWIPVPAPPGISSLGLRGYLMYNPFYAEKPGEVWVVSTEMSGGMFKSNAALTSWTDVTPWARSGYMPTFVGPEDVYIWSAHSIDGGASWSPFGPPPTWGSGDFLFSPDDTRTIYLTDARAGVAKSTDGGATWHDSNQGLTGMRCASMSVSTTDPLRVYAGFHGWGGVYVSDDGTSHWRYAPIADSGQIWQVLQDPFDPELVYAVGGGFYKSTDGGREWPGGDWAPLLPPGAPSGLMGFAGFAADPFQEGHLLVASRVGQSSTHDHDLGYLYSSTDWGATWQSVAVSGAAGSIGPIGDIEFDPETAGTAYLTSDGNGVFRSTDHGATWTRIDDPKQDMLAASSITIATHPQHVLAVLTGGAGLFVSPVDQVEWDDVGTTFENAGTAVHGFSFVDHDSGRLYAITYAGLYFSGNLGGTFTRSAGALGGVQVTTLTSTQADGHTLLYAATTGGDAGAVWGTAATASKMSVAAAEAPESTMVGAGIYRRAQVETTGAFSSAGSQDGWTLESSEHSSKGGTTSSSSSTLRLGDNASKKQYRSVLSFSTGASLPDSAIITRVTLRVRRQGVTGGGDPVTRFQGLMADMKRGYFSTSSSLQKGDFQATASRSYGPFKPTLDGGWYSIDLTGAKAYINKTSASSGRTQIRLRFKRDDDNNRTANYLRLYSSNASTSTRPQLIVSYYTP